MQKQRTPYACHILVCVNDRHGESKSCGDGLGTALKDCLKEQVAARGWKGRVRVSQSGCLGLCARGPNAMIYPQGLWFSSVGREDCDRILDEVAAILAAAHA